MQERKQEMASQQQKRSSLLWNPKPETKEKANGDSGLTKTQPLTL